MNSDSSRSHTIYQLTIERRDADANDNPVDSSHLGAGAGAGIRVSVMNLVDLAGSERQKSTGASGKTLKEGANINKSLLALGAVISKLGEASKQKTKGGGSKGGGGGGGVFIPYRDSKLTRILKQSLGGNTLTAILCTVTPAPMHRLVCQVFSQADRQTDSWGYPLLVLILNWCCKTTNCTSIYRVICVV